MSLRVRAPLPAGDVRRGRGDVPEDAYMGRLVKLVPAEAVGTFPLLLASAKEVMSRRHIGLAGAALAGLLLVAWLLFGSMRADAAPAL